MVERLVRNEEVRGSIPLGSTKDLPDIGWPPRHGFSARLTPRKIATSPGLAPGASAVDPV
jgi:hypothetical protein